MGFKSGCVEEKGERKKHTGEDGNQKKRGRMVDRMARGLRVREGFSFGAEKKTPTVKASATVSLSFFRTCAHAQLCIMCDPS